MIAFNKPYKTALAVIALAGIYMFAGLWGLTMAVPPGYATVFWPPSGFALAAVYIFGYPMALGVFWGAFLTNIINYIGTASPDLMHVFYINAIFIGLGSTAQSCLGAYLIKKYVGQETRLENFSNILKFSVLAGPIACLISATIGVSTLVTSNTIPLSNAPYTFINWYTGDVLGVLVFSPILVLLFSGQVSLKRKSFTTLPLIVIFSIVIIAFFYLQKTDADNKIKNFRFNITLIQDELENRLDDHFQILNAMYALYQSSNAVNEDEFNLFAANTIDNNHLMSGMAFASMVMQEDLEKYLENIRRDNLRDFEFRDFSSAHDGICDPFCTPLYRVYPAQVSRIARGLDVSKNPVRLKTILTALEREKLTISERIILTDSKDKGFISIIPVLHNPNISFGGDYKNIEGFIIGVSSYNLLFNEILKSWHSHGIHLRLYDATKDKQLIYETHRHKNPYSDLNNKFTYTFEENIAGRVWHFTFYLDQNFILANVNWNIWFALAASLVLVFFCSVFLFAITGQTAAVEKIVDQKTREISHSNQFLKMIMDSLPDLVFVKNRFSQIVQHNKSFADIIAPEKREQIIGSTMLESFPKSEADIFKRQDRLAFERGYSENFEGVTDYKGNTRDFYMRKIAFETEAGGQYLLAIGRDITQEQETLDRLQKSEERFRTSIENAPIGMSLVDMNQNWMLYNHALVDMLGYEYDEFAQQSLKDLTHPDDLKKDTVQIKQLIAGEIENYSVEKRYKKKDGTYIWSLLTLALVSDDYNNPQYFVAHNLDITDRKNAEQTKEQLAKIVDSSVAEFYVFDQDTLSLLDVNQAAINNLGYSRAQLLKKTIPSILDNHSKSDLFKKIKPLIAGKKKHVEFDAVHKRKDGSHYDVLVNLQAIEYNDHAAIMAIVLDITDRKTIENNLLRSNKELEEFAYVASHDLKAPLRHVSMSAEFLSHTYQDKLDDKATEFLGIITKSAKRMQNMIDSLMEYSRVGQKSKEDMAPLSLDTIIDEACETLALNISENEANILLGDLSFKIIGNKSLLLQLFQNLIQNAIKYKKPDAPPEISIQARKQERDVIIEVADNGIGISPDHAQTIFQVFKRLHANEDQYEGTGIGLSICQRIVELHEGEIRLDPKYNKGCKFIIKLPFAL
ncbi:MAG: PAS domain S-box protein [Alphaproteobacteria bacterium]